MVDVQTLNKAFIAGEWVNTGNTFSVTNPATGEVIAEVADCGSEQANQAIEATANAFQSWKSLTAYERSAVLEKWGQLLREHSEDVARTISMEMGKTITEARGEVNFSALFIEWYSQEAKRIYGTTVPSQFPNKRLLVQEQPVGPVFAVTPWNFPSAMIARKAAPALAAGCTFVVKPAEATPLTALKLAQLWEKAGGPVGVFQVMTAQDPVHVSKVMMEDSRIRKVTFTGSTPVGKLLYKQAADTIKRISLELGGHAPFIVFEDADIDQAVEQTMIAKFRSIGQSCVAANRVYVDKKIKDQFAEAYTAATKKLIVGDPLADETHVGPLVNQQAVDKVDRHVRDAIEKGAEAVTGGALKEGLFYHPTVLLNVNDDMQVVQEETFGPVAPILSFDSEDEVIQKANNTPYGLAAYFWTRDLGRTYRVAEALDYGIIGVNDGVPSTPQAPFGGVKNSGLGREGGPWGIEEYLETKYISIGLPS